MTNIFVGRRQDTTIPLAVPASVTSKFAKYCGCQTVTIGRSKSKHLTDRWSGTFRQLTGFGPGGLLGVKYDIMLMEKKTVGPGHMTVATVSYNLMYSELLVATNRTFV